MFYLSDQVCGLLQSRLSEVSNTWTISSSQTHSPIVPSQQLVTSASYLLICTIIVNCCIQGVGGRLFVFFAHCWNKSLFFWCRRNFGVLTDRVSELLDCPQPLYVDGQSKCCCESPPVHRSLLARLVCLLVVVVVVVFVFKINGIGDWKKALHSPSYWEPEDENEERGGWGVRGLQRRWPPVMDQCVLPLHIVALPLLVSPRLLGSVISAV